MHFGGDPMESKSEQKIRISLDGDWSMAGITQQFQFLQQLALQLTDPAKKMVSPELDLAGITELDACGCQLLSAFIGTLRQQGFTPLYKGLTEVCDKFRLLGFDQQLDFMQSFSRGRG